MRRADLARRCEIGLIATEGFLFLWGATWSHEFITISYLDVAMGQR